MENVLTTALIRATVTAALLSLAATPGLAKGQTPPPAKAGLLSVETVGLEPTVGKTGDDITATFRVTFKDLIGKGKEILVLEDRMAPDKLPLAPFEAVALAVNKRQVGDLYIWDFVYTLRIVNIKKDLLELPSVTFYWLVRDLGQKIEDAPVLQAQTDPLQFRYVSTITDDPQLSIRDGIELGSFAERAAAFRLVEWVVAPLPLAIWVVAAVLALRRPRAAVVKRITFKADQPEPIIPESPTLRQARRHLRHSVRALGDTTPSGNGSGALELEAGLVTALREFVMAELPELNPGDTARNIRRYIETKVPEGERKETLQALAARMVVYQDGLERGIPTAADPVAEVQEIESLLGRLDLQGRLTDRFRRTLGW